MSHELPAPHDGITTVTGRIDHVCPPDQFFPHPDVIVVPKPHFTTDQAIPQLVVYLACIHRSRIQRGRTDTSIYGVASDGVTFRFVTISHEGVLRTSAVFDILKGDLTLNQVFGFYETERRRRTTVEGMKTQMVMSRFSWTTVKRGAGRKMKQSEDD